MSTIKVTDIVKKSQIQIQDQTGTRWPEQELLGWYNMAQLDIVNHRPDAHSLSIEFNCALGTRQVLPPSALRLIRVLRNEGASKKVITQIDQRILDEQMPNWHDDTNPSDVVTHYVYDDRVPKELMVYPAVKENTKIRMSISTAPEAVVINDFENDSQVISLDDTYANPLMDFILFRAYSKDVKYAGSPQNAIAAWQAYANALGIKAEMDKAITPQPVLEA